MNIYYDYPRKGFTISPPEYIIKDCEVCKEGTCIIGTPEEAIIASHQLEGSNLVNLYLDVHTNAKPEVKLYTEYYHEPANKTFNDVWLVKWFSDDVNYGVFSLVSLNGKIEKSWQVIKTEEIGE